MRWVSVAMPDMRCMKLRAVRSAVRIEPEGPLTVITTSPLCTGWPSAMRIVTSKRLSTKVKTRRPTSVPQRIPSALATILAVPMASGGIQAKVEWSPSPTSSRSADLMMSSKLSV